MTCGYESNNHVAYFIQFLKRNTELLTKDTVMISGQQPSGIYALNSKCFIDENGKKNEDEALILHVWLNRKAMSFHYLMVIVFGGCAITVAYGEPGTGKSTTISALLAMCGCAHNSVFTNAGMLERSSRSTLAYRIDDPSKG